MKPKHPSGRPIRKPEKRDYSMKAYRYTGFICPRLNEEKREKRAYGFIDHSIGDDSKEYSTAMDRKR